MQLFKYLNRKIYILFLITVLLFFISNTASAHTVTSNTNSAVAGKPVTFTSTFIFNQQGGTVIAYINYGDGTSEEVLDNNLLVQMSPPDFSASYTSTHTYSKKGTYIVRIRTVNTGGAPGVSGPNPAIMTQQVSGLDISRIRLYFENNRPEITIKRNQKAPKLYAKIDYSGSGYFKGYWEIDGTRRGYVSKHLAKGPSVTLKYPDIPPIPTYKYGTHNVRFVITNPAMSIDFPYGIYFVTSGEKQAEPVVIKLLQPVEGEDIAYNPLAFKWKPVNKSSIYLISIFSKTKEERIFSAYTRQSEYKLRSNILKVRMRPGGKYIWNVVGFND
ncbi:MAG: PKD domain-containing protein, partial [Desulfobacteraceae bacterium]|nr:PKD domain-containing protein [Desulfobacteraceae bacterium]